MLSLGQLGPELLSGALGIGQDHPADLAAAHQAVVPAEVVVEQQVERRRLAGAQRQDGPMLDFGLQAAAAQRAFDAAIGIKERLGADLLRAGTFDAGDDAERDRFTAARGLREGLEDDVSHEPQDNNALRVRSRARGEVGRKAGKPFPNFRNFPLDACPVPR